MSFPKTVCFLVVSVSLCACATHSPPVPAVSRKISQVSDTKISKEDSHEQKSLQPAPVVPDHVSPSTRPASPNRSAAPSSNLPRAAQQSMASLITQGTVTSSTPSEIVVKSRQQGVDPGLYEDAITLNRVRAALKVTPQGSTVADEIRISSGKVSLTLPTGISPQEGARLIDLVLKAPGVEGVSAKTQ